MTVARNPQPAVSPNGNLAAITWPLTLTMTLMLLLGIASIATLSSLRAYVNGEGRWSKARVRLSRIYAVIVSAATYPTIRGSGSNCRFHSVIGLRG